MTNRPLLNLLFAFLLLAIAPFVAAQETAQEVAKSAKVRGWLVPGEDRSEVVLALKTAAPDTTIPLASTTGGAMAVSPGYAGIRQAGSLVVELKSGENVLVSQAIALKGARHYTLIGFRENGRWQIKAYTDDSSASNAPDRPLRMLNFVDERETELYVAGSLAKKLPARSVDEITVPAKQVGLAIKVLDPQGGPPSQTSTAFDFAQADSGYVLVANDYLGRPDPRVISGGSSPEEAVAELQAPVAPPAPDAANKKTQQLRDLELERRRAQLAALEASERGPNKVPNAAELKRQIEQEIKRLQMSDGVSASAPLSAPSTPR